jgi:hypothetical protein
MAKQDTTAMSQGIGGQLPTQCRLADTSLAHNQPERAMARHHPGEQTLQLCKLGLAADEFGNV